MKRWLLPLLAALLLPGMAAAQTAEARIEAARARALQSGLPVALIDERIAEGLAKGIPAERIAIAVERRATSMMSARQAMRAANIEATTAMLAAGADAVEAGISEQAIRRVMVGARAADRPVALAVLTYLHRDRGIPLDRALDAVTEAMARGPDALRDLPARAGAPGRADGAAGPRRPSGGPPAAVPAPGQRPGGARPNDGGDRPRPPGAGGRP
jgi:hypothetical protein